MDRRLMYVELKTDQNDAGPSTIGWVGRSKTGHTLYYGDLVLRRLKGEELSGYHVDDETGDEYWLASAKRGRPDRFPAGTGPMTVDEDAREAYERITAKLDARRK